jgi:GntR family transcriptional regulator
VQIIVSNTSPVPMYEQIKSQVRDAVHSGAAAEGSLLPSLRGLAAELRVSVITVTRAYNDLVAEGLVTNEHGRGFVVRAVDTETVNTALAARLERAVAEVVAVGKAARLPIDDITRKVQEQWERH